MERFTSFIPPSFSTPRSLSLPTGTSKGVSGVPRPPLQEGLGTGLQQVVNTLLGGAPFDADAVYDRYWRGDYVLADVRTSLFGPYLKGEALAEAVRAVLAVGRQALQHNTGELKAFNGLFMPLLDSAVAEAILPGQSAAVAEPFEAQADPVFPSLASPLASGPLGDQQARRVIHALLDQPSGSDMNPVWALFGSLTGLQVLRAILQVQTVLHDGDKGLKDLIDETHRQRIGEALETMWQSVEVPEEDRLLAELLRGAWRQSPEPVPSSLAPLDAWAVIERLRKGKYAEGDTAAAIELFGGRTGAALWAAIDAVERALREDARSGDRARLSLDERGHLMDALDTFQQALVREAEAIDASVRELIAQLQGPLGSGQAFADTLGVAQEIIDKIDSAASPRTLEKRQAWFDTRMYAFKRALEQGGLFHLLRLLKGLSPLRQWQVLAVLVEDPELLGQYPALLGLEGDVYRSYVASQRGDLPLVQLRNWYRLSRRTGASAAVPAVPVGFDAEQWVGALRIMLYQRHPEPSSDRKELLRALDKYQQALGVRTDRELAEGLWLESVQAALAVSDSGHALLEALRHRLGNDSNAALALMAALAAPETDFTEDQRVLMVLVHRAAALLMAKHQHSLPCIGVPYLKARTPQRLNILYPREPRPGASEAVKAHHAQRVLDCNAHIVLVDQDIRLVQAWLTHPPSTRTGPDGQAIALTPGEQCDMLLCAMALPPQRVELALLKIAQSCTDPALRERYLLVCRLQSELVYSERNFVVLNQSMSAGDILWRLLGVVFNGVREGLAHGLALYAVRVIAHYMVYLQGGYFALPALGLVSVAISLWAWRHLEQGTSPDYELNPSPFVDVLISLVPSLNTLALTGLTLATGALPMTLGITLPFDGGEALYLMNLVRLLRQLMQSGTQPFARLFRLTDARGAGLPAQLAFFVNCGRDALYMGGSIGFLMFLARQLDDLMAQWGPPRSAGELMLYLLLKTLPSTLNETLDGMNPDIAILIARLLSWLRAFLGLGEDELMLQPGVPMQWEAVPRHMADHIAGRCNIVGLQDPFNALAALMKELGLHELALFFHWLAVIINGFLGALRGRVLAYRVTTDPRASAMAPHDGFHPRNPDGLLVAMGYLGSAAMSGVRGAVCGPGPSGPALPAQTGTRLPPQLREGPRQRANSLLLSSRGQDTPPPKPARRPASERSSSSSEDDSPATFVDLSGGTPVLRRQPIDPNDEAGSDTLVELDGTPRWRRGPLDYRSDDFSEQ